MTDQDADRADTVGPPSDAPPEPALGRDEAELLAAFDRLRPQGTVKWAFDDAVRRVDQPDLDSSAGALPWKGLPDDLWDRGRSARIGQRFVGDVARVMAEVLAADARSVADAAVAAVNGDRFVATWDAFQYLNARVEALEARVDPLGLEVAEWPAPVADPSEWTGAVGAWFAGTDADLPVVVGESGDGAIVDALRRDGRTVRGVDPRGAAVWRALAPSSGDGAGASEGGGDGPGPATAGPPVDIVFDHVERQLRSTPDGSVAGVVLIGCVDRSDLGTKLDLLGQAVRATVSGGAVAVLATDQSAWDAALSNPARDLARGRPLHPDTWSLLLDRMGATDAVWHRPRSGSVHAVVARVVR